MVTLDATPRIGGFPFSSCQNVQVRLERTAFFGTAFRAIHRSRHGQRISVLILCPLHVVPLERMPLAAVRTRHIELAFVALLVPVVDLGRPLDGRRAHNDDLPVPKVLSALDSKFQRIAFFRFTVAVHFVTEKNANRTRRKTGRRVRPDQSEIAALIVFHANRRTRLLGRASPVLSFLEFPLKPDRDLKHWLDALL